MAQQLLIGLPPTHPPSVLAPLKWGCAEALRQCSTSHSTTAALKAPWAETLCDWRQWPLFAAACEAKPNAVATDLLIGHGNASARQQTHLRAALQALPKIAISTGAHALGPAVTVWAQQLLSLPPEDNLPKAPPVAPSWWKCHTIPPFKTRTGQRLSPTDLDALLTLITVTHPLYPHPVLAQLRSDCGPSACDRFALSLLSAWEAGGCHREQDWAMWAALYLGGPTCVRTLMGRLLRWQHLGQSDLAQRVPIILWGMNTPFSRLYLRHLCMTASSHAVQKIAKQAWIHPRTPPSTDHIPLVDLGFNASRQRAITTKGQHVVLTITACPHRGLDLQSAEPTPKHIQQTAIWRAIRQDLLVLAQTFTRLLEEMMCGHHGWDVVTFQHHAAHAVSRSLLERVMWCVRNSQGIPLWVVHIDDVLTGNVSLPQGAHIAPIHPIHLTTPTQHRPPVQPSLFAQQSRKVFHIEPREHTAIALDRYQGRDVPQGLLFARLRQGWFWGGVARGGGLREICFPLHGTERAVAHIQLMPGVRKGRHTTQKLGRITVHRGEQLVPLGQLSLVAFSELVRNIDALFSDMC